MRRFYLVMAYYSVVLAFAAHLVAFAVLDVLCVIFFLHYWARARARETR